MQAFNEEMYRPIDVTPKEAKAFKSADIEDKPRTQAQKRRRGRPSKKDQLRKQADAVYGQRPEIQVGLPASPEGYG